MSALPVKYFYKECFEMLMTFYLSEKFSSKSYPHRLNLTLLKYYKNNIRDKFPEFTQNGNFLFVESFFKKMDDILQTRNKISSCSNGTSRSACRQFSISIPFLRGLVQQSTF